MEQRDRKTGVILVNVGTPDAPQTAEVRRYLRQFLSDPRVLDMNPIGRWLLLNLVILPFRPARSAEAYRKIWTSEGSPLLLHARAHAEGVGLALGDRYVVRVAMRYGNPSIESVLDELEREAVDRLVVFPLYPQYASSTTGTCTEEVIRLASKRWNVPAITTVEPFYDDDGLLDAFAGVGRPVLADLDPEHVLFSFHGLPERHVRKSDLSGQHCLELDDCCDAVGRVNKYCYRAHCFATARGIAAKLGLADDTWSVAFQSRLGRTPWIRPYTDEVIVELAKKGTKRVAVYCPAFVADCLETLEEIGIRAREDFIAHGGEELRLVPSLNAEHAWVETAAELVRSAVAG
jgi:ferrochelatase